MTFLGEVSLNLHFHGEELPRLLDRLTHHLRAIAAGASGFGLVIATPVHCRHAHEIVCTGDAMSSTTCNEGGGLRRIRAGGRGSRNEEQLSAAATPSALDQCIIQVADAEISRVE